MLKFIFIQRNSILFDHKKNCTHTHKKVRHQQFASDFHVDKPFSCAICMKQFRINKIGSIFCCCCRLFASFAFSVVVGLVLFSIRIYIQIQSIQIYIIIRMTTVIHNTPFDRSIFTSSQFEPSVNIHQYERWMVDRCLQRVRLIQMRIGISESTSPYFHHSNERIFTMRNAVFSMDPVECSHLEGILQ